MECPNCGKMADDNSMFCENCGTSLISNQSQNTALPVNNYTFKNKKIQALKIFGI